MSIAGKLIGAWAVGKTVSNTTPLVFRLLAGMVAITACAMFAAIVAAGIVAGAVWFFYTELTGHGVDPQVTVLILGSLLLALVSAIVLYIQHHWFRLRTMSKQMLNSQSPITARLNTVTDAFMNGFLSGSPSK